MRTTHLVTAAALAAAASSTALADLVIEFDDLAAAGWEYHSIGTNYTGTLTGVSVNATLQEDAFNSTWAADISLLIMDGDTQLLQAGGYTDFGAVEYSHWPGAAPWNGNSSAAGTNITDSYTLQVPLEVTGLELFLGNGYELGGVGVWSGTMTLHGVALIPAPASLAMLAIAGFARTRRRA